MNLMEVIREYSITDIIHSAALLDDRPSIKRPYQYLITNIVGSVNLLEITRMLKIRRLIIVSSRAAYGPYPPEEGALKEESALKPLAFYGVSKASVDMIVPLYRKYYGTDVISVRPTGIFGPGQGEEGRGFVGNTTIIYNILKQVLKGEPFRLSSGGDHRLEFCYVKDLAKGIKLVFDAEKLNYPIYNISFGKQYRIKEVADMIREILPNSEIHIGPGYLEGTEVRAALDISRAEKELGYKPLPLKENIMHFISYLSANK